MCTWYVFGELDNSFTKCFAVRKVGLSHYQLPDNGFYSAITPLQRIHFCINSSLLKYVFNDSEFKRGKFLI